MLLFYKEKGMTSGQKQIRFFKALFRISNFIFWLIIAASLIFSNPFSYPVLGWKITILIVGSICLSSGVALNFLEKKGEKN